jgi:hypothetical protein
MCTTSPFRSKTNPLETEDEHIQKAIEYEFPTHNPKIVQSEHRIQQIQFSDWTLLE